MEGNCEKIKVFYYYYSYSIGSENISVLHSTINLLTDASLISQTSYTFGKLIMQNFIDIGSTYKLIALNFCLSQIVPISEFLALMDYH